MWQLPIVLTIQKKKHTSGSLCVPLGNPLLFNFLTSINFDNLSEKIKNLRLVINFKFIHTGGNYLMNNFKKIFTYMVVGALVMALSISCKNEDKTGSWDSGFNLDDIPTVSGDAATYFTGSYTFSGTLARQSFEGISEEEANAGTLSASMPITVTINANKITVNSELGLISETQLNKGNYPSISSGYNAGGEYNADGMHNKEYIDIRGLIDKDGFTSVSVSESEVSGIYVSYYIGSIQNFDGQTYNFKAEYYGKLTKQGS